VVRSLDNGIGIGIIEKDASYLHYYSRCLLEPEAHAPLKET